MESKKTFFGKMWYSFVSWYVKKRLKLPNDTKILYPSLKKGYSRPIAKDDQ